MRKWLAVCPLMMLAGPVLASESVAVAQLFGTPLGAEHHQYDVAPVLADVLGRISNLRVVATGASVGDPLSNGSLSADQLRGWADRSDVDHIVVGHTEGPDVVVELLSGHSGVALAEYRLASLALREIPGAVQRLAQLILADLGEEGAVLNDALPPVSAAAVLADSGETSVAKEAASGAGDDPGDGIALLPGPRRDDPISINSDELEVLPEAGGRRLVFSHNVEVLQGDVTLNADRLEAIYPQGASQPDTLLATGHVRVHQGDRRARCEEATYERTANTIVCRGKAEVTQGCDRVRGQEIEFDLTRERVRVSGAASVVIQAEDEDAGTCPDGSSEPGAES